MESKEEFENWVREAEYRWKYLGHNIKILNAGWNKFKNVLVLLGFAFLIVLILTGLVESLGVFEQLKDTFVVNVVHDISPDLKALINKTIGG